MYYLIYNTFEFTKFFITLTEDPLPMLDEKHTIFGIVAEGLETL